MEAAQLKCKRPGCNKAYLESENSDTACAFHNGGPIFHDIKKGWACCNQIVYDWEEFEKLKGCCVGKHTDIKQDAAGFEKSGGKSSTDEKEASKPVLKTADDFNKEEEQKNIEKKEEQAKKVKKVVMRDGKFICGNKGCTNLKFLEEENTSESCNFHSGVPVFHDLKKYWSCCLDKVTYEFDDFQKIETCSVGEHIKKYK